MKSDYTHLIAILDRSGSMNHLRADVIGGFNVFLTEQQALPGEATFTLVLFDHEYLSPYNRAPLHLVQPLTERTYVPRGNTALHDAIGRAIDDEGKWLSRLPESERPDKVAVLIYTDGFENASKIYNFDWVDGVREKVGGARIARMIDHQRSKYNWQFLFMGANQDAIASAGKLGIGAAAALTYEANEVGMAAVFAASSGALASYRCNLTRSMSFTPEDRAEQELARKPLAGPVKPLPK